MKKKHLLLGALLALTACGDGQPPPNTPNLQQTLPSVEDFQIYKMGENLALEKLEVTNNEVINFEARGTITEALTWFSAAPDVAVFSAPGTLRVSGEARFLVGAFNTKASYYFVVETPAVRQSLSPTASIPRQDLTPSCVPTSCEAEAKNCGNIIDGCGYFLSCGSCSGADTCGGAGQMNVCGHMDVACVPRTCESLGKNCGSISDGCGGSLNCGTCDEAGESCGASGIENVCALPPPPDQPPSVDSDPYMDQIVSYQAGAGAGFGQASLPGIVLGPPHGNGAAMGGLDVLSLGRGGQIILRSTTPILNGPGADLIVFENAFYAAGNPMNPFSEPGQVSLSQDGTTFYDFPCDAANAAAHFPGCAGVHPTLANPSSNAIDPTDPTVAGGDAFDMELLHLDWAIYVKITDRGAGGAAGPSAGFDLDAVSIVYQ